MPSIKIYPPTPLPDRKVDETQFNIWTEEIEVYLSQENDFALFLPGGLYENWASFETNNLRIAALHQNDRVTAGGNITAERAAAENAAKLPKRQRDLRIVLSIIGKCDITTQSSVTPPACSGSTTPSGVTMTFSRKAFISSTSWT